MKFEQYQSHKKTNIPLFKEIPSTWNVVALQYISRLKSGSSITALDFDEEAKYPVYGGNGFRGLIDKFTHEGTYVLIGRQGALCGNINIAKEKFFATEHALVVTPTIKLNASWLAYTLTAMELNQYSVSAAQPGLSAEVLARLKIALPSIQEQQKIADFLNFKTAQIDALIAKKEALLLKLQEKRSALITQAVTKGIQPNVAMKPSGVEWLGDVPAHWEVLSLRHTLTEPLSNGLFKKKDQWGSGSRIVDVFDIYVAGDVIDENSLQRVDCNEFELSKYSALHGDFFFVRSSLKLEGIGKSALVNEPQEKMVFECHLVRGRPDLQKVEPKFYIYLLNSQYCRQTLVALSNQVTMTTLDQEKFKGLKVPLPPKDEQAIISKYLDEKTSAIDKQLTKTEDVISKLNEYRTSLITNAVTGKIDVREFDLNKVVA